MNGFCRCTSAPIHPAEFKHVFENGAVSSSLPRNNKENKMLKKFAVALVATALIAGPAFAQSNGTSGATPAAPAAQTAPAAPTASTPAAKPSRQDNEGGQAHGKARAPSRLTQQKERRVASGASCQAGQDASGRSGEIRQDSRNRASLPAIRNMHPTMVRTEARIVMHRLADAGRRNAVRSASRILVVLQRIKMKKLRIREAGRRAGLRSLSVYKFVCHSTGTCS